MSLSPAECHSARDQVCWIARVPVAYLLQSATGMATCDFGGSYYNPEPWTNTPCAVTTSVPEGCPVHLVSGLASDPTISTVDDATDMFVPSTTTIVGTDTRSFTIPDELSCDCSPIGISVAFKQIEVTIPSATAGDTIHMWGMGYDAAITITAPGPCAAPAWPTDYSVALACDRCPPSGGGSGSETAEEGELGGCAIGSESSIALVAALLLVVRRRR